MKKYTIALIWLTCIGLIAMVLFSCSTATISDETQNIEGCEYIVTKNSYGNGLTHKGNCKNPIHQCK
jgi:hypothetical protein